MVGASLGEFEAGYSQHGRTREHAMLAYATGIRKLIVLINQMDNRHIEYQKERYQEITGEMTLFFKKRLPDLDYVFVPTSMAKGDNVLERSENMPWYKGPTLLGLLNRITGISRLSEVQMEEVRPSTKNLHAPFFVSRRSSLFSPVRVHVFQVWKMEEQTDRLIVHARVDSGLLKVGQELEMVPRKQHSEKFTVEHIAENYITRFV